MSFTSFVFVAFLFLTFLIYYIPRVSKYQVLILVSASIVFYCYQQMFFIILLLLSVSINVISSYYVVYGPKSWKKSIALAGVVLNLLLLLLFKYGPLSAKVFFSEGDAIGRLLLTIPVPLGISFSTFQGISLVIDVFRGRDGTASQLVPVSFPQHIKQIFLYRSFFPQLVAGPIIRAHQFIPQIGEKKISDIDWELCFKTLITGYFLKMVVADNLKDFTFWITYPYFLSQHSGTLVFMLIGYSCQIFADFAGYSLIAIGLARLFGYRIPDNFNFPYISTSIKDFWSRWHISLSTWLRDYLFLPTAYFCSARMPKETYLGIKTENWIYLFSTMVTFFICGFWHGAGVSFILWGCLFGAGLVLERFITTAIKNYRKRKKIRGAAALVINFFNWLIVFSFVTVLWIFFKLSDLKWIEAYFRTIFTDGKLGEIKFIISIILYSFPVVIYHLVYLLRKNYWYEGIKKYEYVGYGLMIFFIVTNSGSSISFIYFQF